MTAVLDARGLGKRYRRRWALQDCTLDIPAGHVTGLVGPNGAGKTTLLSLATGILTPTAGAIEVCGRPPARDGAQLANPSAATRTRCPSEPSIASASELLSHRPS